MWRFLGFGSATLVDGNVYEIANVDADAAFPSSITAFYNMFRIDWELSLDDGTTWRYIGTSSNPLYVCLDDPISSTASMFRTVVHLAVSNQGATDADEAFNNTWELFSTGGTAPANPSTWNGTLIHYYKPGTNFLENGSGSVTQLLQDGTGNCYAWARLFEAALSVNGVSFTRIQAKMHPNSQSTDFWVSSWSSLGAVFYFNNSIQDMQPPPSGSPPSGGTYGYYDNGAGTHFKNNNTVPGQGTGGDAPSQKVFDIHRFTQKGGTYYDACYGCTYSGASNFETHLAGHGYQLAAGPPLEMSFSSAFTSPHVIEFSEAPD